MRLNRLFVRVPRLLRLVEPVGGRSVLMQRLGMALALAEASPEGSRALARAGRARSLLALAADGMLEVLALPLRLAATVVQR